MKRGRAHGKDKLSIDLIMDAGEYAVKKTFKTIYYIPEGRENIKNQEMCKHSLTT